MAEKDGNGNEPNSSSIEKILQERDRLDQVLKDKYRKRITILFTDICGYTQYIDEMGDIRGRSLLLKHNSILLPTIENGNGKVTEIIGDAVMASFENSLDAVKAAIEIQEALKRHNSEAETVDKIHVKVGINTGEALVDDTVVFQSITGDVANVASRIQSQAEKDQILISSSVYEEVSRSEDILCRFHDTVPVKGKAEPLTIYRVVWQHEEAIVNGDPKVRMYETSLEVKEERQINAIHLEVTREGDRLKISANERLEGEETTLKHYEEIPISMDSIERRCNELVETLNKANRRGLVTRDVLIKLREIGQVLHDELFTFDVKKTLKNTKAQFLHLNLDDQLVHIPWELLSDGKEFLCQKFNMGRLVKTRQNFAGIVNRPMGIPLKMLILADPKGDLKGAYQEGTDIRDFMDKSGDLVSSTLRSDNITPDSIREKLRNFDIVHFAGHADYSPQNPEESGWRLSEGSLKTTDIIKMTEGAAMPALIFSNACQSARTEAWTLGAQFEDEIFGLANAFLLSGVKHYVGTFWEILDKPSSRFAREFYKFLLSGMPVGEAMRLARTSLIREYGEETIIWASYLLYGDPTFTYVDQSKKPELGEDVAPPQDKRSASEVRAREKPVDQEAEPIKRRRKPNFLKWAVAVGILLLACAIFLFFPWGAKKGPSETERQALAYFKDGKYPETIKACEALREENPKRVLSYVLMGNIHFSEGDLGKAHHYFKKALEAEDGSGSERAEALSGLGRIASLQNKTEDALSLYQQAANFAPKQTRTWVSQAVLMNRKGEYDGALKLLGKAGALSPDDRSIRAILNETQEMAAVAQSVEKQERIDRLVTDLLKNIDKAVAPAPTDGWTSLPLTAWVMDLKTLGYGFHEGEEKLIALGIADHLIEKSRVQVVERAILDKLLEELKLGTSKLVDRKTALSLGKILAARLIFSGKIIHAGSETQISMRLIETETGRISMSINETFHTPVSPSIAAEKVSKALIPKLNSFYPLRGNISQVKEKEIVLNIGSRHGVKTGQQFEVLDTGWELEVISVQRDESTAKIIKGAGSIKSGLKVEALKKADLSPVQGS